MKLTLNTILYTLLIPISGWSQQTMLLEDAIAIALQNNFDIQLALNVEKQAQNNQHIYNTGFLPTVSANGNGNYANNNTSFTTQQGIENNINGAEIQSVGASVGLNYVIFNGGARKFQFDRLKQQYALSTAQTQNQIENTLIDVYTTFFNVARNQAQKLVLEAAFTISKDRYSRVLGQQKYGLKTSLDVLNAKVDFNTDSINLVNIDVEMANNKRNLNFLLARDIAVLFTVENQVNLDPSISLDKLKNAMDSNNVQLKQMALNKEISEHSLGISKAGWMPNVSASASYGYDYRDNGQVGFFQNQRSNGLNAGVSFAWDIFDGGATQTQVQNARLNIENQTINEKRLKLSLNNQLSILWANYTNQTMLIDNEKTNEVVSNQNFLKSKELFNLGQIPSLDFRQAQLNLIRTQLNLLSATYNAKIIELQLKRFAGLLVD